MSEQSTGRKRDSLMGPRLLWGGLALSTVILGIAIGDSISIATRDPQKPAKPLPVTDALAVYVGCPGRTQAAVAEVVQPQDSDPGTIGLTCKDSDRDPHRPDSITTVDVAPYSNATPDAQELGLGRATKFVFRLIDSPADSLFGPSLKFHPPKGATPFAFIELSGVSDIQGPVPQPSPNSLAA